MIPKVRLRLISFWVWLSINLSSPKLSGSNFHRIGKGWSAFAPKKNPRLPFQATGTGSNSDSNIFCYYNFSGSFCQLQHAWRPANEISLLGFHRLTSVERHSAWARVADSRCHPWMPCSCGIPIEADLRPQLVQHPGNKFTDPLYIWPACFTLLLIPESCIWKPPTCAPLEGSCKIQAIAPTNSSFLFPCSRAAAYSQTELESSLRTKDSTKWGWNSWLIAGWPRRARTSPMWWSESEPKSDRNRHRKCPQRCGRTCARP